MSYITRLKNIDTIILDLDGVLTDGTVLVTESGEQLRKMFIRDGYAMQLAAKVGYILMVISGGNSQTVVGRLEKLGVHEIHIGAKNKVELIEELLKKHGKTWEQVLYMGDDIPDTDVLLKANIATAPADAVPEIKAISHYISDKKGGEGCVRDVIEKVMKARNNWNNEFSILTRST
jgi:3-deoxy-D-manno-octulosonate 8-phosphate phosphatase (KDO 8-P phosphatase)